MENDGGLLKGLCRMAEGRDVLAETTSNRAWNGDGRWGPWNGRGLGRAGSGAVPRINALLQQLREASEHLL